MKKIYTTLFSVVAFSLTIFAQIPNNSFESWVTVGTHQNPEFWGTMNNKTAAANIYTATKATPGNPGSSYLKLTSKTISGSVVNGIAVSGVLDSMTLLPKSGFAFSQRPQSFTGNYQHMIYGTSQGSMTVKLTRWNAVTNQRETIANANKTLVGMDMSWTPFTVNFVYTSGGTPDTCIIVLKASGTTPAVNDYLWVDNLAFTGFVVGINEEKIVENAINVYPNPCHNSMNISLYSEKYAHVVIQLFDITGKSVKTEDLGYLQGTIEKNINTGTLTKGLYFLNIISDNKSVVRRIEVY